MIIFRRQHDSSSSLIEHRHSMSICESSNSSSDQSDQSVSSGISKTSSLSPELRMRPKSTSGSEGVDKSLAHMSCPDLETMVARYFKSIYFPNKILSKFRHTHLHSILVYFAFVQSIFTDLLKDSNKKHRLI